MVKGHANSTRVGRGDTPRIRRGNGSKVSSVAIRDQSAMGSEVRSLRLRVEPFGHCYLNGKGYPAISGGAHRKEYLHRVVWEKIAGKKIPKGFTVHHMNGKLCWCPHQLVALGPGLHAHPAIRDPYTGEFMSRDAYLRRYGKDA